MYIGIRFLFIQYAANQREIVEALRGPSVHFVMPCLDLLEVVVGDPRIDLGERTTLDHASDAY